MRQPSSRCCTSSALKTALKVLLERPCVGEVALGIGNIYLDRMVRDFFPELDRAHLT
jgi:hypothetical protein